ncbi:MAG: hypothetical protein AAF692_04465 [Pseudomonadota bacterium]
MKTTVLAAALLVLGAAAPALADGHEAKTQEATANKLTIENTIEELMSNEAAAAVLEKHLPGIGSHMMYDFFKGWTLAELAPQSGGLVTDDTIAKIKADLDALNA